VDVFKPEIWASSSFNRSATFASPRFIQFSKGERRLDFWLTLLRVGNAKLRCQSS